MARNLKFEESWGGPERRTFVCLGAGALPRARRGAEGLAVETPLLLLGGLTLAGIALLPFAAAAAIRINLR